MKTISVFAFAVGMVPTTGWTADALLRQFATCAGRYSAQMEHQWLIGVDDGGSAEDRRASFVDLIDALVSVDTASGTLAVRIEAKHAQSVLLQRASFASGQRQRDWAADRAGSALRECLSLVDVPPTRKAHADSLNETPAGPTRVRN